MARSPDEVLDELLSLSPTGWAWGGMLDPSSNYAGMLRPLAGCVSNLEADAEALLPQIDPSQATTLLSAWESVLALPDPCAGETPALSDRQRQALARLTDQGGCSADYFTTFAKALGFEVTITGFKPLCFGDAFGSPWYGEDWSFAWQINITGGRTDTAVLGCEILSRAPGQTVPIFTDTRSGQGDLGSDFADIGVAA